MAPEVQDSGYGLSADLWSAGCLLYTMMTGVAPFQGRLVGETLSKARTGRYVEPEGLSDAASDFLASMLELDPTRRLSVEQASIHPFLSLDKDGTVSTATTARSRSALRSQNEQQKHHRRRPAVSSVSASKRPLKVKDAVGNGDANGKGGAVGGHAVHTHHRPPPSPSPLQTASSGRSGQGGDTRRVAQGGGSPATDSHHGTSTLTASTTLLGSDRCSLNSSLMEREEEREGGQDGASITTLRAEHVPTPATIGKGAAAAAARVRRAKTPASLPTRVPGSVYADQGLLPGVVGAGAADKGKKAAQASAGTEGARSNWGSGGKTGDKFCGGVGRRSDKGVAGKYPGRESTHDRYDWTGGVAAVEVLPDGRASISVGARWLVSSGDGTRVWWSGDGNGGRGERRCSRDGPGALSDNSTSTGQRLAALPEALHPLYRSLAGIVDALRSKTVKVVLRHGEGRAGEGRARLGGSEDGR
ncbi:unnamed protein product [Sphacelaria rigidula]